MFGFALFLGAAFAGPYAVVLGTAQDAGHPQVGCTQTCCADAWASGGHAVSAIGIVDPATGQHWLLDASPDLPQQLHALPGTLAGIFPTHAHMGHYTGLMYLGREALGATGIGVWAMPRMAEFLTQNGPWDQLVRLGNIRLHPLSDGVSVQLTEGISLTPVQVPHRDEYSETVGFVVRGPMGSILYLPDIDKWERWSQPIEALVQTVDRAWLDGTFYDAGELPGRDMSEIPHPFIVESIARFQTLSTSDRARVHFIHLNHTNPALNPASESHGAIKRAGFGVATIGDRVDL